MASSSQGERGDLFEFRGDVRYIFLSHSGAQKDFVENLYYALEKAHQEPFLDIISLPKASRFPDDIKRAVHHCKLGVAVLSNDFMMSNWPMFELEMLFQEGKRILPLFYKLQPEDLKSKENLSKWREKWEMMPKVSAEQVKKWEGHVKELRAINGIVFTQQHRENSYINQVVAEICKLVPSQPVYDLSFMQGHQDLVKEVEKLFDERKCEGPRMVGFHGVGGSGKTTLCMSMVNFYVSLYNGRSYLIEFPTDGEESTVLRVCKKFLKKLGSPSDHVYKGVDKLEQVTQQMKDLMTRHNIFLAFDNVWPKTEKTAERLMSVGFSAASKILLTSRSEQVLLNLLNGHSNKNKNSYVGPLPTLKREDASKIFEQSLGEFTSSVRNHMDNLVEKCRFGGNYHPLSLQALSKYVRKSLDVSGLQKPGVLKEIDKICLETVRDSIKINYELLSEDMKCLFLDIALLIECNIYEPLRDVYSGEDLEKALVRCLCIFDEKLLMSEVDQMIYGLAEAGVIQRKADEVGPKMIEVHDLYLELAQNEANRSRRILTSPEADEVGPKMIKVHDLYLELAQNEANRSRRILTSPKAVEGIDWPQLERLKIFEEVEDNHFIKQQQSCPKLKFCYCSNIKIVDRILMMSMPSLCILIIKGSYLNYLITSFIGFGDLMQCSMASSKVDLSGYQKLAFVWLQDCLFKHIDGLSALQNLQMLFIFTCQNLNNLDGLSSLTKLEILAVASCNDLMKLPDLGGLTGLERLMLEGNESLEEVGDLGAALKEVTISQCMGLKRFGGWIGSERLTLKDNASLEEVGCVGAALKEVNILWCTGLKKLPDFGNLAGLERLTLEGNKSLEEVGHLGAALKEVTISGCTGLKKFGGSIGLERLMLTANASLEEVGCVGAALKEVTISWCTGLKKLSDFGNSTGLERLTLEGNKSLEEVGHLGAALKEVTISRCTGLKKFVGSIGLERLTLEANASLEEMICVGAALKEVTISCCRDLKKLPDFGGSTGLQRLTLKDNCSLEEVGCVGAALKEVTILACSGLKKLTDFGGMTGLERLTLNHNWSLEDMGSVGAALKEMTIFKCALKKLPDVSGLTGLKRLTLVDNWAMEEVGCLGPTLKEVSIVGCSALKKLPDVDGLTGLKRLTLEGNGSLEKRFIPPLASRPEDWRNSWLGYQW